jgi:drug/metabolite transporter (DMT)-like permease
MVASPATTEVARNSSHVPAAVGKALIATLCWGVSFIAMRMALECAEPFGVVWMRNAVGAALLFAMLRAKGEALLPLREDRARCFGLGLLMGVHMLLQSTSMKLTTAMRAGWIVAFIPVVVAAGARVFLKQRMRGFGWVGIGVATLGVLVLTSTRPEQFADASAGDLLMLASTFTWAAYSLLSIGPSRRSGGLRVSAASLAVSVLPSAAAAAWFGTWHVEPTARSIGALAFLAICASALSMWMFADALAVLGPERTAAFQYLQPFVTLVASFVVLGEPFTVALFVGGPLVLAGVWLVQRAKRAAVTSPPVE